MIGIGDFARLGRVSVRMLRHYDAIGLLRPERVDPSTGYRSYGIEQLARLNRVVALKDLGLRLDQVRQVVDAQVSSDELRAMLRLRQAELESQLAEAGHRLARVEARLRLIEVEDSMSQMEITTKQVAAMTTLGLSAVAASATQEDVGPVISGLYPRIIELLGATNAHPVGPSVAYYVPAPEESDDALRLSATFPTSEPEVPGLEPVSIPAAEVASVIHRGGMDTVDATYQTLNRWVGEQGFTATGCAREVYLEMSDDPADWITEIQLEFTR